MLTITLADLGHALLNETPFFAGFLLTAVVDQVARKIFTIEKGSYADWAVIGGSFVAGCAFSAVLIPHSTFFYFTFRKAAEICAVELVAFLVVQSVAKDFNILLFLPGALFGWSLTLGINRKLLIATTIVQQVDQYHQLFNKYLETCKEFFKTAF